MPLPILIVLVACGIAGIAWLIHASGLSRARTFDTEDDARAAWGREFPDLPAGTVTLTAKRAAALVMTSEGPGLVWPMGSDSTARLLHGSRAQPTADGLDLRLPDPSAPRLRLILTQDETQAWARIIEASKARHDS
ncbi:hypothetical protein [Sagittula salina]|uniref:Uncharacterized protein n=1 Tax=Sagittula salina TaxID=2820268 RepID=A0A940S3X2_9RHOB|nr:hypothetical protein [Sagittula salina]MBP0483260.1 hypothetical protein [Sagittula salina]